MGEAVKDLLLKNEAVYRVTYAIHRLGRRMFMRWVQLRRGVDLNKVTFSSFRGSNYNDNPRAISERLHELKPDCDIVWLFDSRLVDKIETPDYVRKAAQISRAGLIEQATAGFWVDNFVRAESLYLNPQKQYYINTWHGDRGFKRVGDDNEKLRLKKVYRLEDHCAMMIAGSEFGKGTYRTAFHFQGEVLMDGCPRNDVLMNGDPEKAAAVRKKLGVGEDTRLLLYAPTYRDDHQEKMQSAVLDISRTLDFLEKTTGEKWKCLYRAHYLNAGLIVREDPRQLDMSRWQEMSELLLVSDMLITDYSSCGGDFALQRRPVFLYQPDAREYLENSRSFYFNPDESPFLVAHSQEELEELIARTDARAARENCEALDRFFGTTETGHATDAVCDYIMKRMKR